jgi:glucose/arabinose dehydrogenase
MTTDLELIVDGLSFPTSVTFDDAGRVFVAESGLPFGGAEPGGRIWCVESGDRWLVAGDLRAPVNGLVWHGGDLFVSEGGHPQGISKIGPDGSRATVLEGLPGPGNYQLNMTAVGPDGKLYFSQGAMTNTAIVGLDSYEIGWLGRLPHAHDIPGYDVVLAGVNVETDDPVAAGDRQRTSTGAFSSFGTTTEAGQRISGEVPATAALMRCNLDGSDLELVAWGLRNAYGLLFLSDGRLLAVDQGADDRGSRPVGNVPDLLFEVEEGAWYGWPDFIGGTPMTDERFRPTRGPAPTAVLANHDTLPEPARALVEFPPHAAATKLDVAPPSREWAGHLFVALFGDEAPMTAPPGPKVGRGVARVDPADWSLHPFLREGLNRPIDVRFDPTGQWLHIVDFGEFEMSDQGLEAVPGTGKLWRLAFSNRQAATDSTDEPAAPTREER